MKEFAWEHDMPLSGSYSIGSVHELSEDTASLPRNPSGLRILMICR